MAVMNSFPTGNPSGLPILDTRAIVAGWPFQTPSGPRLGMLHGLDVVGGVVKPTNQMAYSVGTFTAFTSASPGGAELINNSGAIIVPTTAAPGVNARYDLIYARARFTASGDAANLPEVGVVQGVVAPASSAVVPALPSGAIRLGVALVSAGASNTAAAGVTISNNGPLTTWSGGVLVVRTAGELTNDSAISGAQAVALDSGRAYVYRSPAWVPVINENDTGWIDISLANGVTVVDGLTPQYRVINNLTHLSGRLLTRAPGGTIGNIPQAHAVRRNARIGVLQNNVGATPGVLVLNSDGSMGTAADTTINLDGVVFVRRG